MFQIFTDFASWLIYGVVGLSSTSKLGTSLHFFVEDVTKIFALLLVMIYIIAAIRASLKIEKIRNYIASKNRFLGYFLGSSFGAVTPFCSCSSIPLFLGFTTAGIPLGVTISFLITSPLINEVAVLLLLGLLGWKFTILYVVVGISVGIVGGWFLDAIKAERWLQPLVTTAMNNAKINNITTDNSTLSTKITFKERHEFAKVETIEIFKRVWLWVIIGVGLGAALHGYVPEGWITDNLGSGQWWSVPGAVFLGLPLYSNATGIIPVMESLIVNGLPIGTTLAFCMSTVAASFPEFILLKQVMKWKLLAVFYFMLLISFTIIGWLFNFVFI